MPYGGFELRTPHVPRNAPLGLNSWKRSFHESTTQTLWETGSTATSRGCANAPGGAGLRGVGVHPRATHRSGENFSNRKLP